MPTLPKGPPGKPGDLRLVLIDRNNLDRGALERHVQLAATCSPFRLSITIEASSRFAAERRRGDLVSISCATRAAFASFNTQQ
jgi:hypothetical protein